jgi:hypothetical protein
LFERHKTLSVSALIFEGKKKYTAQFSS